MKRNEHVKQPSHDVLHREVSRILGETKKPINQESWSLLLDDVLSKSEKSLRARLRARRHSIDKIMVEYFKEKEKNKQTRDGGAREQKPFKSSLRASLDRQDEMARPNISLPQKCDKTKRVDESCKTNPIRQFASTLKASASSFTPDFSGEFQSSLKASLGHDASTDSRSSSRRKNSREYKDERDRTRAKEKVNKKGGDLKSSGPRPSEKSGPLEFFQERKESTVSDDQRKISSEKLRIKFEARRLEREQLTKHTMPIRKEHEEPQVIRNEKDTRVKEYYAELYREDEKNKAAIPPPKAFKSSVLGSIKPQARQKVEKIVYTVEQLRRMNRRTLSLPGDLPDMTVVQAEPHRCQTKRQSSTKSVGRSQRDRKTQREPHRSGYRDGLRKGVRRDRRDQETYEPVLDGPVEPLKMSANRWAPGKKEDSSIGGVAKVVKSILNKMTRERFEKLTSDLLQVKALEEPNFADVYADLCKMLHTKMSTMWPFIHAVECPSEKKYYAVALQLEVESASGPYGSVEEAQKSSKGNDKAIPKDELVDPRFYLCGERVSIVFKPRSSSGQSYYVHALQKADLKEFEPMIGPFDSALEATDKLAKQTTVKRLLLNSVQEEFNRENRHLELIAADSEFLTLDPNEKKRREAVYVSRAKSTSLGNIRFIGALFKVEMLNESAVQRCILKLLGLKLVTTARGLAAQTVRMPDEEDIEALCKLLATVGKKVDHDGVRDIMDAVTLRIVELSERKDVFSSRIRFMLKDILEMRDYRWEPRHQALQQKTLDEVRKEAERLQREGKNAQHDSISAVRRRTKKSSHQLALERSNLLLHSDSSKGLSEDPSVVNVQKEEPKNTAEVVTETSSAAADEKIRTGIKNTIEEYIILQDLHEAAACIKEFSTEAGPLIAEQALNMALEAKEPVRQLVADFLSGLYEHGTISATSVEAGFRTVLEFLDDMHIDIPLVHIYAGLVIGRMVAAGCFGLSYLQRACQHLTESGLAEQLLVAVLAVVKTESDADTISTLVSDVKLEFFFAAKNRTREYVEAFQARNESLFCDEHDDEGASERDDDGDDDAAADDEALQLDSPRLQSRMNSILEEYLAIQDADEVCTCVEELPAVAMGKFVSLAVGDALERKPADRIKIATMLELLYDHNVIEAVDIQDGLHEHFEVFEDIRVDIPRLEGYMSEILCPLLSSRAVSLDWIVAQTTHLVDSGIAIKLFDEMARRLLTEYGAEKTGELLTESSMTSEEQLASLHADVDQGMVDKVSAWLKQACSISSK